MMRGRERFSPAQCRAARGLLNLSRRRLAEAARLELEAIELYEREQGDLSTAEKIVLGAALNAAGAIALPEGWAGEGVRLVQLREPVRTPFAPGRPDGPHGFDELPLGARRDLVRRLAKALAEWLCASPGARRARVG